jgi:hypothetical protein
MTPAMKIGISSRLWEIDDIVELIENDSNCPTTENR